MNIFDTIAQRHSVRNFNGQPLGEAQSNAILDSIRRVSTPFGGGFSIQLASVDNNDDFRPSTYGVIKGARNYLLLGIDDDERSWLSGGYAMEQVVLDITAMQLATCWVSGTFNSSTFKAASQFAEGQKLVAVVPVGIPADKRSFIEKVMRTFAKCGTRKPFSSMFFINDFSTPLPDNGPFAKPLEMVRWAPSAVNAQPWKALVGEKRVDFYYKGDGKAKILDMGIALCHFSLACEALNIAGAYTQDNRHAPGPDGTNYLTTFIEA